MRFILLILLFLTVEFQSMAQVPTNFNSIHSFAIAVPQSNRLDEFLGFMEKVLAPAGINTLILRVDYNYQYKSYPSLRNEDALSEKEVKQLVKLAKKLEMELVPQINLLGHQSWATEVENLLKVYPQFDETPQVKMPKKYEWPNDDALYCKSYCPLHPEVHQVVFALVDEIVEVFEANSFHAGMDEVFYLADDQCPRCKGKDKAVVFADEVTLISEHLAKSNSRLWIWGDRLLEGAISGLGMWEASENGTEAAIDLIPKNVVICDWHYENAEPTAVIFASKGFDVISCFWNKDTVATAHMQMIDGFRTNANKNMKARYRGTMQTIWSPAGKFLDAWYNPEPETQNGQVDSFKAMIKHIEENK